MAQYVAVNAVYEPREKGRAILRRAGQTVELSGEAAEHLLDRGAVRDPEDSDGDETSIEDFEVVDLPKRPANSASGADWRAYLAELDQVTREECGPLEVPEDAKRDDLIALGDARVQKWNEA